MEILAKEKMKESLAFARQRRDTSLIQCLKRLRNVERASRQRNAPCYTKIFSDFAPYSFYFERYAVQKIQGEEICIGNGGIIFHGAHDGYGSGQAPTFSVCLTPSDGWEIQT